MLAGAACCGFGSMIGFGGGIFMVPILVAGFEASIPHAIGACAIALFPSSVVSSIGNLRQRLVDFPVLGLLEVPTMIGAVAGAFLTNVLPVKALEVVFAAFVLFLAYKMSRQPDPQTVRPSMVAKLNRLGPRIHCKWGVEKYTVGVIASTILGAFSGLLAGIFGIGGGFLKMPIMLSVFGMPVRVAVATALCGIVLTSFAASLSHASLGNITFTYAAPTILGFSIGAFVANNYLKKRFVNLDIRWLVVVGLTLAGLAIVFNILRNW